jgi:DNA-directed RNA polymerase subunit RPC12/RpoP
LEEKQGASYYVYCSICTYFLKKIHSRKEVKNLKFNTIDFRENFYLIYIFRNSQFFLKNKNVIWKGRFDSIFNWCFYQNTQVIYLFLSYRCISCSTYILFYFEIQDTLFRFCSCGHKINIKRNTIQGKNTCINRKNLLSRRMRPISCESIITEMISIQKLLFKQ